MRILKVVAVTWVLFLVVTITWAAMSGGPPANPALPSSSSALATDSRAATMLQSDMRMLERMRAATSPMMNTMIEANPMWRDPEMIRAQEQYQAQIDRMLARG